MNAVLGWSLIFGHLGLPALGIFGAGLASSLTWMLLALSILFVVKADRQFRRFYLFGEWWCADWNRYRSLWRLGLPMGLSLALEGAVFAATAYLMGLIDEDSVAAHAIAIPDYTDDLHGADGARSGGYGARRPCPWQKVCPKVIEPSTNSHVRS